MHWLMQQDKIYQPTYQIKKYLPCSPISEWLIDNEKVMIEKVVNPEEVRCDVIRYIKKEDYIFFVPDMLTTVTNAKNRQLSDFDSVPAIMQRSIELLFQSLFNESVLNETDSDDYVPPVNNNKIALNVLRCDEVLRGEWYVVDIDELKPEICFILASFYYNKFDQKDRKLVVTLLLKKEDLFKQLQEKQLVGQIKKNEQEINKNIEAELSKQCNNFKNSTIILNFEKIVKSNSLKQLNYRLSILQNNILNYYRDFLLINIIGPVYNKLLYKIFPNIINKKNNEYQDLEEKINTFSLLYSELNSAIKFDSKFFFLKIRFEILKKLYDHCGMISNTAIILCIATLFCYTYMDGKK